MFLLLHSLAKENEVTDTQNSASSDPSGEQGPVRRISHSLTHSLTHSCTHSRTHSPTHSPRPHYYVIIRAATQTLSALISNELDAVREFSSSMSHKSTPTRYLTVTPHYCTLTSAITIRYHGVRPKTKLRWPWPSLKA